MTELEFFVIFEMRPDAGNEGRAVEVWRRGSGIYGKLRAVDTELFEATVATERGWRTVGKPAKTFAAAFKALRAALAYEIV